MKKDSHHYDLHILVCTNEKAKGSSCGPKGAQSLLENLKLWSKTAGFKGKIRINKSGCLGSCEQGIACVAYPKGDWILEARPEDEEQIKQWIKEHVESQ